MKVYGAASTARNLAEGTHPHPEGEAVQEQDRRNALVLQLAVELGKEVDAKLRQGGEEGLTDQTCRRWLTARKWHFSSAKRDLAAHAEWRASYMPPGGRITEDDKLVKENILERKGFIQGLDNYGHPILLGRADMHLPKSVESTARYVTYCVDAVEALGRLVQGWDGFGVGLIYLTGMAWKNADFHAGKGLFNTLQQHFPERLYRLFIWDSPTVFQMMWKVSQPFIDPVTARKVVFVDPKQGNQELRDMVPLELLPPEMGGTGTWRPIDQAWKDILAGNVDSFRPPRRALTSSGLASSKGQDEAGDSTAVGTKTAAEAVVQFPGHGDRVSPSMLPV